VIRVPPKVKVIGSRVCEKSLKPCIEFHLEIACEPDEIPIIISGLLYSENGKLLSHLVPKTYQPAPQDTGCNLIAGMSREYERLKVKGHIAKGPHNSCSISRS